MLIHEVCKKCSLTKKAVEYYIEQGFVTPLVQKNGYRDFSMEDIIRLKKIFVLRGLGVSVSEIKLILSNDNTKLNEISHKKIMEITALQEKQKLIEELAKTQDWDKVQDKLQQLQKKQSILERFRNVFPGYYGNLICQHFAPYLNAPVQTEKQQEAFETIIAFLDNVHFELPDDLRSYYDEITLDFADKNFEDIFANMREAFSDIEKFVAENREKIESYRTYKQTEEYKATQAYRLEEALKQFNSTSGYNDIFIPAMCQLSEAYNQYYQTLQKANERFLQMEPNWMEH